MTPYRIFFHIFSPNYYPYFLHSYQVIHVKSFISSHSYQVIRIKSFVSSHSYQVIHLCKKITTEFPKFSSLFISAVRIFYLSLIKLSSLNTNFRRHHYLLLIPQVPPQQPPGLSLPPPRLSWQFLPVFFHSV